MNRRALSLAGELLEIAGPLFLSLREGVTPASPTATASANHDDLTFTQLRALLAIQSGTDQVGKLTRSFGVAQSSVSKLIDHLIARGLVRRTPSPDDRRQHRLALSRRGESVVRRIRARAARKYGAAIRALPAAERRELVRGVAAIRRILQRSNGVAP